MKVVINTCFGGFGLSDEAETLYAKKAGFDIYRYKQAKYRHESGKDLYVRCKDNDKDVFLTYTFKEDHGDSFSEFPEDGGYWYSCDVERNDPLLVEVVEELGKKANGYCANLEVIEIPDNVDWYVEEYDGNEHIAESHNTWR